MVPERAGEIMAEIAPQAVENLYNRLNKEAEGGGYHLNPDVEFSALYVSDKALKGQATLSQIPERRPPKEEREKLKRQAIAETVSRLSLPIWRCRVCGYLCAREHPPEICPICKARQDRFEIFLK